MNTSQFKSVRRLGIVVICFYAALLVATAVSIGAGYFEVDILTRMMGGEFVTEAEVIDVDNVYVAANSIMLALIIIAFILFLVWIYKTRKNLYYLRAAEVRFTPGWSVGYFFIPILNLFRPYQVVNETWKASNPNVDYQRPSSWKELSSSNLVGCWWGLTISSSIVGFIVARMSPSFNATLSEILNAVYIGLVNDAIVIGTTVTTIIIVKIITRFQDEKYHLINYCCPSCGQELEESMLYCPNCGAEVKA